MPNPTCIWNDGCDREARAQSGGLCAMHIQRARKHGLTAFYADLLRAGKVCPQCQQAFSRPRSRAIYCSKACYNAWYRQNGSARPSVELQRAYSRKSYRNRRDAEVSERAPRGCAECGSMFDANYRTNKKFCSRACVNKTRLREKPQQAREANQRRRARVKAAGSPGVSPRDWTRLLNRHGRSCAYCGSKEQITIDHIIPISRGGRHAIGNVLPACFSCNASKRDDLLANWLRGRPSARLSQSRAS